MFINIALFLERVGFVFNYGLITTNPLLITMIFATFILNYKIFDPKLRFENNFNVHLSLSKLVSNE